MLTYPWLPALVVAIAGAVMYSVSSPSQTKAGEIGRLAWWCGLLVFLLRLGVGERLHVP